MTVKQAKQIIEDLADEIDNYLHELELVGKDDTDKYHTLLFLTNGLRDLLEEEI